MTGNLIDFSSAKQLVNDYNGAATKIKVEFNGQIYLLKFGQVLEPDPKKPLQASYENSPLSEHISSSMFWSSGILTGNQTLPRCVRR